MIKVYTIYNKLLKNIFIKFISKNANYVISHIQVASTRVREFFVYVIIPCIYFRESIRISRILIFINFHKKVRYFFLLKRKPSILCYISLKSDHFIQFLNKK